MWANVFILKLTVPKVTVCYTTEAIQNWESIHLSCYSVINYQLFTWTYPGNCRKIELEDTNYQVIDADFIILQLHAIYSCSIYWFSLEPWWMFIQVECESNLVFPKWICQIRQICQILLKCLLFTQNTSNLVQNVDNIDLRYSWMK